MTGSDLVPIGVCAKRSGLTSSALRFYDDVGLLRPARVDAVTGYRYYSPEQVAKAGVLSQLREIGMPLSSVGEVLEAGPQQATQVIDEHIAKTLQDVAAAQRTAAALKAALGYAPGRPICLLPGPVLAQAVDQVLTAAAREPAAPVLGGVRIEATHESISLTATDRYRLATRTLVPTQACASGWAETVDGAQLQVIVPEIRRSPRVWIETTAHALWFRPVDTAAVRCGFLSEQFPDYRPMLAALGPVTTRATVARNPFVRVLEGHHGTQLALDITSAGVTVVSWTDGHCRILDQLTGAVTGSDLLVWFELSTRYPALSTATGPEVMIDLRGPGQPATIRSADCGDLTTVAMPAQPEHGNRKTRTSP